MGILQKTSSIFRLSSNSKSAVGRNSSTPRSVTPEEFQPLIKRLLTVQTLDSPEAKKVLSEIKELASGCSPFLAASEIQRCARRFSFTDGEGAQLDRSRAFELAAKLHWENLHHQVSDADDGGRPLGPTVYATFLDELLECLIQSKEALIAVQIPLLLNEEFLLRTLTPTAYTPTLITLITRTMDSILDYAVVQDHPSAPSGNGSEEESEPPPALPSGPILFINAGTRDYLTSQKALLAKIGQEISDVLDGGNPLEGDLDDATLRERKKAYSEVLLGIVERHRYDALAGAISGVLSELSTEDDPDAGLRHARHAAASYTAQAAQDRELHLTLMAERHQHEADRLSKIVEKVEAGQPTDQMPNPLTGANGTPEADEGDLPGA